MDKKAKKPKKLRISMNRYGHKRAVKYSCLVAKETTSKELRIFLNQEIDLIDHFFDYWKKYD